MGKKTMNKRKKDYESPVTESAGCALRRSPVVVNTEFEQALNELI